jgi:hypothetical protein
MHVDWKMLWSVMTALGYVDSPDGGEYHEKTADLFRKNWVTEDKAGRLVLNMAEADAMVKDAFLSGQIEARKEVVEYLINKGGL